MRIGFFGKGGSGKTTITAGYVRNLVENQKKENVLAIDADHNKHLGESLGIEKEPDPLGNFRDDIREFVKGDREDIKMVATTPPAKDSNFIKIQQGDEFLEKYAVNHGGVSLLTVGSYQEEDRGATCYHGKLDALTYVMNHLIDAEQDQVAIDATAGVDTFGSSLVTAYDLNILVVEPTQKAVEVYNEFNELMSGYHSETAVIVNKVETEQDRQFIKDRIPEEKILGFVNRSNKLRKFEQGKEEAFSGFVDENSEVFDNILKKSEEIGKDWSSYMESLKKIHISGSEAWWDEYHDEEISSQAETDFSYEKMVREK